VIASSLGKKLRPVIVAASIAMLGACMSSPPQPESMRDPHANFAAYKTFGWTADGADPANGQTVQILDSSIRAAIKAELIRKGYAEAPTGTPPDLRITYETASATKLKNNPVSVGVGVGSWGGNSGGSVNVGSSSVRNVKEGTLVVHAIDNARNAEAWQGKVSAEMKQGNIEAAAVNAAVAAAMRDFPARQP
jgi:hypothetical protein